MNEEHTHSCCFEPVDDQKISKTIDSIHPNTSSGFHGISSQLLNLKSSKKYLSIKRVKYSLCNYRPLSLLPAISKVIEKIMCSQLDNFFMTQKHLYDNQYGFQTEHSTAFAALELADRVVTCMDHNDTPTNIYLDFSKAFDALDHEILLAKLQHDDMVHH